MNKENLRKCIVYYENFEIECYFHKWIEVPEKELHPYNESEDKIVIITKALVEHIETGAIHTIRISSFQNFID